MTEAIDEICQAGGPHEIRFTHEDEVVFGEWDLSLLRRVIGNLLSNAVKYSPDGDDVLVSLTTEGAMAAITVQDAGIGIPAADLPLVFEFRRRGSNVGAIGGSGVGLAGAKRIVEQHGGTITATSEEHRGSMFTVRLPLTPAP